MVVNLKKLVWKTRLALTGNVLRNLRKLQGWQCLDDTQTRQLQGNRLKRLLIHAYSHVPYYREVLTGAGVADEGGAIRMDRFHHIPLLDKATIRHRFKDLRSDDLDSRRWYENTSGGSTGEPVRLIQDRDYFEMASAVKILDDIWSGYSAGEKKIILWGSERDLFGGEKLKTLVGRWLRSEVCFNAFRMTPAQMGQCVKDINALKPVQILAYVGNLYELSRFTERERLRIDHNPKSIMTTAGVLQPAMRETIERVFKAPIFDRYGSREVGDVACECHRHEGLHIAAPVQYVEVLRPDGSRADPGEMGEIVITNLSNYAMPIIRYRIGDIGVMSTCPCSCGMAWPVIKEIKGRTTDIFVTGEGTQISGEYFTHLFYFRDWVGKFQVVQEDYDHVHISIVPCEMRTDRIISIEREMREITEKIEYLMGQGCKVSYNFVNDIPPSPSGKYRYTMSKLRN